MQGPCLNSRRAGPTRDERDLLLFQHKENKAKQMQVMSAGAAQSAQGSDGQRPLPVHQGIMHTKHCPGSLCEQVWQFREQVYVPFLFLCHSRQKAIKSRQPGPPEVTASNKAIRSVVVLQGTDFLRGRPRFVKPLR